MLCIKKSTAHEEVLRFMQVEERRHDSPPAKVFLGYRQAMPPGTAFWQAKIGQPLGLPSLPKERRIEDSGIKLRENQYEVAKKSQGKRAGMVLAKPGFGKTVLMCQFCFQWDTPTLILVHASNMVKQTAEEFKNFRGVDCGQWYGSVKRLAPITITTYQSAVKHKQMFIDYFDSFGCPYNLIIDECDTFMSTKRRAFTCTFPATRKWGFTGTNTITKWDKDEWGNDRQKYEERYINALKRFWGYTVYGVADASKHALKEVYYHKHENQPYEDDFGLPMRPVEWVKYKNQHLDTDYDRLDEMVEYIHNNLEEGEDAIILLDRVAHVDYIWNMLERKNLYRYHGQLSKKEREQTKNSINKNGGILVAQYRTAGRGFNIPRLKKAFILFPIKDEAQVQQMAGRVDRYFEGRDGIIYEWVDSDLNFQWKRRKAVYENKLNLPVICLNENT